MAKKTSKNKFNTDLFKVLKKAVQQTNQGRKLENTNLNIEYKKIAKSSSARSRRQAEKSAAGRIESAKKIAKPRIPQVKIRKPTVKKVSSTQPSAAIKSVTHRTRAEYLEQSKQTFLKRFVERLGESYPDWRQEWNPRVIKALSRLSAQQLDDMMNMINLDKMYYESNAYSVNRGATGQALYEYFVQFETE